jgi:hypothetical protein
MNKLNYGFDAPAIMRNLIIFGILVPFVGLLIPYFTENTILKYSGFLIIFVGLKRLIINMIVKRFGVKYNKVQNSHKIFSTYFLKALQAVF